MARCVLLRMVGYVGLAGSVRCALAAVSFGECRNSLLGVRIRGDTVCSGERFTPLDSMALAGWTLGRSWGLGGLTWKHSGPPGKGHAWRGASMATRVLFWHTGRGGTERGASGCLDPLGTSCATLWVGFVLSFTSMCT